MGGGRRARLEAGKQLRPSGQVNADGGQYWASAGSSGERMKR